MNQGGFGNGGQFGGANMFGGGFCDDMFRDMCEKCFGKDNNFFGDFSIEKSFFKRPKALKFY